MRLLFGSLGILFLFFIIASPTQAQVDDFEVVQVGEDLDYCKTLSLAVDATGGYVALVARIDRSTFVEKFSLVLQDNEHNTRKEIEFGDSIIVSQFSILSSYDNGVSFVANVPSSSDFVVVKYSVTDDVLQFTRLKDVPSTFYGFNGSAIDESGGVLVNGNIDNAYVLRFNHGI